MKRFYLAHRGISLIIALMLITGFSFTVKGQAYTFTSGSTTYSQNFDVMGPSGTTYPTGWTGYRWAGTGTIGATLNPVVTDGSASSGAMYNVGTTSADERALGTLASGSTIPRFGCSFLNNTGGNITSIDFSFYMEQWRSGSSSAVNEIVAFEYSLNATSLSDGNWTAYNALDLNEKLTSTTAAAAVNGNDAANRTAVSSTLSLTWTAGTNLWIRWSDADNTGSDGIYSVDDLSMTVTYSSSVDPEPTSHVTAFASGTITYNSIVLNWTGSTGAQLPAGYLLLGKKGAGTFASVADGTPVANDADWGDNNFAINLSHVVGANTYTVTGLAENTEYSFKIYPYTNSGTNINFKTDGTVPSVTASTLVAPVTIESEDFATCPSADWQIVNQDGDNKLWACDANSMKANGYGATPAGSISDDWLISPVINLNNYTDEILTFETKTQYTGPALKCKYSTNYTGTGNPNSAAWTEFSFTPATTTTWVSSGNVNLSGISGSAVYIAFHYTSTGTLTNEAASWWVDNILITGTLSGTPDPEPSNHVTGFASSAHDFRSVTLQWTGSTGAQLPAGYLVLGKKGAGTYASVADGAPVADDADWSNNNFAKNVVHSSGTNTLTVSGLSAETQYSFVIYPYTNSGIYIDFKTDGTIPSASQTTDISPVLYSGFDTDLEGWTAVSVASNKNWTWLSGAVSINGYSGDVASEDWLISPELNLNNFTDEILTFKTWTKFSDIVAGLEVKYTTSYSGSPSTTTWVDLSPTLPASNSQVWTSSGNIDLSAILTTTFRLAFKYTCSGTGSTTATQWQVDDVTITGTPGSVVIDQNSKAGEPDVQVGSYSYSSLLDTPDEAVPVMKFKIFDLATTDTLPTVVTQITLKPGASNTANWSTTLAGIKLIDGTPVTISNVSITNSSIVMTFTGTNLKINSGSYREITVETYFKTTVTDGSVLQFTIPQTDHGFVASGSGSTFATDFGASVTSSIFPIDVEAVALTITAPANFIPNTNFTVTVYARDLNNNIDLDNQATVTLTANGGGVLSSATGLTQNLGNGSYTWSDLRYSTEESFSITASASGFTPVTSSQLQPLGNIPAGYYDAASGKTGAELKTALYNIIKGHTVISYDGLWTAYQTTDVRSDGKVWDMYSNCVFTFGSDQCGNYSGECDCYNREHSMPKSWFNDVAPMNSDAFMVVPTDGYVNGIRGNYAFGVVGTANYTSGNGCKRGDNVYPGYTGTVFEPADEFKGDFARIYFYMATRYENLIAGWENYDNDGDAMMDGSSFPCFEPWALSMLMEWSANDPVSPKEISRNNAVYALQNNRNPYVDHPEWVNTVWGTSSCTPPTTQATSFASSAIAQTQATVSWTRGNGDAVLVLAKQAGAVDSDPVDGSVYTANAAFGSGNQIGMGNYVVYNGTGTSVTVTNLSYGTKYYFAIYEYKNTGTCYNATELYGNLTTLPKDEPSNHVTNLAQGTVTSNTIQITWTDAAGPVLPDYYLVRYSKVGYANIPVPVDGTAVANNDSVINIAYSVQECNFNNLQPSTTYYFKVFPYSNTGSNINFKTDGTVPEVTVVTGAAPSGVTESFTNIPTASSTSYTARTWTGDNGLTWTAQGARTDQTLNGKAICFGTSGTRNVISPTVSGGMLNLSFKYVRGFTNTNARTIEVYVNGTQIGTAITVSTTSDEIMTFTDPVNVSGNVQLEIRSTAAGQVKIDDISWSGTADLTPPVVTFSPLNNATNVALNAPVTISFNEPVRKTDGYPINNEDVASLVEFRKTNISGAQVPFTGTISGNKQVITLTPSSLLDISQVYFVALKTDAVEDYAGNNAPATEITFTTVTPTLTLNTPLEGSTYYQGNNLNITWTSQYIDSVKIELSRNSVNIINTNVLASSGSYIYPILNNAIASNNYSVVVSDKLHPGITDNATFTVADTTPPAILTLSPLDNATSVPVTGNLVITVNEPVFKGTGNISIYTSADILFASVDVNSADVSISGTEITIQHAGFIGLTAYYVLIPSGVIIDQSNNSLLITSKTTWNFTTLDNIPPVVTLSPINGATAVAVNQNLTISFNEPVRKLNNTVIQNTDLAAMLTLKTPDENGTTVAFSATINPGKTVITIDPTVNFEGLQSYYFGISASVEDASDNAISASYAAFTTASADVPVVTFSPQDGETNVAVNTNITITFSEPVRKTDNAVIENADLPDLLLLKKTNPAGIDVAFSASINTEKTIITIDPGADLLSETVYYSALLSGIEDEQDNPVDPVSVTFTTADVIAPDVTFYPADGAVNVDDQSNITITFSEPVRKYNNDELTNGELGNYLVFTRDSATGQSMSYAATINTEKTVITIDPAGVFSSEQLYYAGLLQGLEDYSDNAVSASHITFTSEDNLAPQVTFIPEMGTSNVANNALLYIYFSEPVRKSDNTAVGNADLSQYILFKKTDISGENVLYTASINTEKTIITVDPDQDFDSEQIYYFAIANGLEDKNNNPVPSVWTVFTSADNLAPVVTITPANSQTNVPVVEVVTFSFTEAVYKSGGVAITPSDLAALIDLRKTNSSGETVPYTSTVTSTNWTVTPVSVFDYGQVYYAALKPNVVFDLAGNPVQPTSSTFTTQAQPAPNHETFNNLGSSTSYIDGTFLGQDGSTWSYTKARHDQTINGKAICFQNTGTPYVMSGTLQNGIKSIEFLHQQKFSGSGGKITAVEINGINKLAVAANVGTSVDTVRINDINTAGPFTLKIITNGVARVAVDDIKWTNYVLVSSITVSGEGGANTISQDNGTLQMVATVLPAIANNRAVTWSVINGTGMATINQNGLLTALTNGTVTVVATANDDSGVTGSLIVTISNQVVPVESLSISPTGGVSVINVDNGTLQFNATITPVYATNKTLLWSVTNISGMATISQTGLLTAIKNGTVRVKASTTDGSALTDSADITLSNQIVLIDNISLTSQGGRDTIDVDNGTLQMVAVVTPIYATNQAIIWSVINETGVATINQSGLLKAVAGGTVTVKAAASDTSEVYATRQIVLTNQNDDVLVTSITISSAGNVNYIDQDNGTLQLTAAVLPSNASIQTVTWTINNVSGYATISVSGLVTALANGTVTAIATANDGSEVYATFQITITNQVEAVQQITVTSATDQINTDNGTLQMNAEVLPVYATNKAVTWSVTNQTGMATISATGLLTAVANGTVLVVATAQDGSGISGSKQITLSNQFVPVESIVVTSQTGATTITQDNGTLQMVANVYAVYASVQTVTWAVENQTGMASISGTGLLTAITNGTVLVKATATDGSNVFGSLQITISGQVVPVESIVVTSVGNVDQITTDNGTLQMIATVSPAYADNMTVTWSVANGTGIATISQTGVLTAVANGTVTVTATANDGSGITGSKIITISGQVVAVESITVTSQPGVTTITVDNGTLQMVATVSPVYASITAVTWTVENQTGIATISASGLLTAVANGTVLVKATATDGSNVFGSLQITLSNQVVPVSSINITSATTQFVINTDNGTLQLTANVSPAYATNQAVTWSVENISGEAQINQSGLLTAVDNGIVEVTATAQDGSGVSATVAVTITNQQPDDTQPPAFVAPYPQVVSISQTSASLEVKLNEPGQMFYNIKTTNTAPLVSELLATTPVNITQANQVVATSLPGLVANTHYYVFLIARDIAQNVQAAISMVEFTTLGIAPQIAQQPADAVLCQGLQTVFAVTATGSLPLTYTWYHNNTAIGNSNNAQLTIPSVQPADAGQYWCKVTNVAGEIYSDTVSLTVQLPVIIAVQPVSGNVCQGQSYVFSVTATGDNITYQWFKNDALMQGAESNQLSFTGAQPSDAGAYQCRLSGTCTSSIFTNEVTLQVNLVPFAGDDNAITVYDTANAIQLSDYLEGETAGGTWYDEAANIVADGIFSPATAGQGEYIFIYITGAAPCTPDTAYLDVTVEHYNAIITVRERKVKIYPNPFSYRVDIATDDFADAIEIINHNGLLISRISEIKPGTTTLNLSALPQGLYMIRTIFTDGKINMQKVVKQ